MIININNNNNEFVCKRVRRLYKNKIKTVRFFRSIDNIFCFVYGALLNCGIKIFSFFLFVCFFCGKSPPDTTAGGNAGRGEKD